MRTVVTDRAQAPATQEVRQLIGTDLIALVPLLGRAAAIADEHAIDHRPQQVVEPLRLRAFLERDMNRAAHAAEELHERHRLRGSGTLSW